MKKVKCLEDIFDEQGPTSQANHVGIEIEFWCPFDDSWVAGAFFGTPVAKYVTLGDDGSIQIPNCSLCHGGGCVECDGTGAKGYSHELKVLVPQYNVKTVVTNICTVLKRLKAKVNGSCGLHVHLDMRNRDQAKAYSNLAKAQNVFYLMNPLRRRMGEYSTPVIYTDLAAASSYEGSRYRGINWHSLDRHRTLEVRTHRGTVNAAEIINWVKLLVKTVDAKDLPGVVTSLPELTKVVRLGSEVKEHAQTLITKYATEHSEYAA